MKSALDSIPLHRISSILRQASGWHGIGMCCDREQVQGTGRSLAKFTEGVGGFERSDSSVRGYVATSPLFRSFISSKYSRIESKRDRKRVVAVKSASAGPESRVVHGANLAFKALNQTGLQESTKSVVLGSLLGDCTLQIVKGEYILGAFEYVFSTHVTDYVGCFHWKLELLNDQGFMVLN